MPFSAENRTSSAYQDSLILVPRQSDFPYGRIGRSPDPAFLVNLYQPAIMLDVIRRYVLEILDSLVAIKTPVANFLDANDPNYHELRRVLVE